MISRKSSVLCQSCSWGIRSAKSFVIEPRSTVFTQTFSRVSANLISSSLSSSFPLYFRPLDHAKIDAIGFVDVCFPS